MESSLSRDVQMQFMRPGQLEAAIRDFPVAYVPFGLIEWHGRHLPLGNDAIKAHAILVKCAEQFGGAVYPPQWLHSGFDQERLVPIYTELFQRLKSTGFRVIIGISGHNVQGQIDMINKALEPATADGTAAGIGLWEMTLSQCDESNSDHAAKWETSNMMFFYPDCVDMSELGDEEIISEMKKIAVKMADAVERVGVDKDGGLFLESVRFGSHVRTNKHWWLQAENLVGFMNAFELTGDGKYWETVKLSWNFIDRHVIDHYATRR